MKAAALMACLNSFALDALAGMKMGGTNLSYFIVKQLPVLPPETFDEIASWSDSPSDTVANWISRRVVELTYTAPDMQPWAEELGFRGPPFRFEEERRMHLKAELDACFFHLYGYHKNQVETALESFPIIRKHELDVYGEYATKELILEKFEYLK